MKHILTLLAALLLAPLAALPGVPFIFVLAVAGSIGLAVPVSALEAPQNLLQNPGLEQLDAANVPAGWKLAVGRVKSPLATGAAHGGKIALHVAGDGQRVEWRQEVADLPTRIYMASGWFRANKLQINPAASSPEYARLYFHIYYKDRPDADRTGAFVDLPLDTYDWRRLSVRLVPKAGWTIAKIRVSVVARFSAGSFDFDDLSLATPPVRSGAFASEWANGLRPAVITDMGLCAPSKSLSSKAEKGCWQIIDYETGSMKGRMLWASEEAEAAPLAIPLNTNGWHAIFVGLATSSSIFESHALLRLSSDRAYVQRTFVGGAINEVFFKAADLSGQSLHISQESGGRGRSCGIAFVKLVPLTPEEVAAVKADRQDTSSRKLAATCDGYSYIWTRRPTSVEALLQEVEQYRHTDFDTLILQMGGADLVNYPSKVGNMLGQNLTVFPRRGDRFYAEAIRELARQNINPTEVLIEGAQNAGLKVHVGIRMGAWTSTPPYIFNSHFYHEHPEWRCVDRDGAPVARMSLAVPQVRLHLVELLREAVRFGADGASLLYNREVPVVLFEKPFCELFKQRYDGDALSLPEDDKRILQLRAELVTTFMREVRAMLDAEGQRRADGRRLVLSAFLLADEADNMQFGLNLRDWVAQGLVDEIFPYVNPSRAIYRARQYDMKFYTEVCGPRNVRVRPTFKAGKLTDLETLMKHSLELYDSGADGITAWDVGCLFEKTELWPGVSRLGHVEELHMSTEAPPPAPVFYKFQSIGGLVVNGRYHPNGGY